MELVGPAWIKSSEKRMEDVVTALGLLAVAFPAIVLSSGLIVAEDHKRSFFSQKRVGKDGELFNLYKLRTMSRTDYNDQSKGPNDNRATGIGKFLRISTLDETPQLLNILSGHMSIIGPRPLLPIDYERMENNLPPVIYNKWLTSVTESKPGLVSSFGIYSRTESFSFNNSLLLRAQLDIQDYDLASRKHDSFLKRKAIKVGKSIVRSLIVRNR